MQRVNRLHFAWWALFFALPCAVGTAAEGTPEYKVYVPDTVSVAMHSPVLLIGEISDEVQSDSLGLSVEGLPPGLIAVEGIRFDDLNRKQLRIYGFFDASVRVGDEFHLTWRLTNGRMELSEATLMRVVSDPAPDTTLEERVRDTITARGDIRERVARALGPQALPHLCQMLRDERLKPYWRRVAMAIGVSGNPVYFDTLHDFIWHRFRGPIDAPTFSAICAAQGALGAMATISPRVARYLTAHSNLDAYDSLPWTIAAEDWAAWVGELRDATFWSLRDTDNQEADRFFAAEATFHDSSWVERLRQSALRGHRRIRQDGFLWIWDVERDDIGR